MATRGGAIRIRGRTRVPCRSSPLARRRTVGQVFGIALPAPCAAEPNEVIGENAVGRVALPGIHPAGIQIVLRPGDEECTGLVQAIEPQEVSVGAVHEVDGAGFGDQKVEHVDVMELAVGDMDKTRIAPCRSSSAASPLPWSTGTVPRGTPTGTSMVVASRARPLKNVVVDAVAERRTDPEGRPSRKGYHASAGVGLAQPRTRRSRSDRCGENERRLPLSRHAGQRFQPPGLGLKCASSLPSTPSQASASAGASLR